MKGGPCHGHFPTLAQEATLDRRHYAEELCKEIQFL